jgi:SAM-dependent methyltransferase
MSFEAVLPENQRRADFSRRACLSELMDEPCSYEELRGCLRDLEKVNSVTFGHRPALEWLEQFARSAREGDRLHIVDVGCGGGDMLRQVEQWAAGRRFAVRLTGIDLNPYAARAAREFTPDGSQIRWITGDAYSFDATADPVDVVISSLFAHHLPDDGIVRFLGWMERVSRRGWFINDLYRSRTPYLGFKVLALAMRWHRFVRNDGPVSIRRAFLPDDWRKYVERAGLSLSDVRIFTHWPGRLCVARVKPR